MSPEELESFEMPFTVKANLTGLDESELQIVPDWDEHIGESRFHVILDGVELGTLCNFSEDYFEQPQGQWKWLDGNLDIGDANTIGKEIDSHYF